MEATQTRPGRDIMTQSTPPPTPPPPHAADAAHAADASPALSPRRREPVVAIVGRPNVGKSSLLNMLAGTRISIVDAQAGVTRDRVSTVATLQDSDMEHPARPVELVDTGGHGIEDVADLTVEVEAQIAHALADANLVLFVIDAQTGVLPLDEAVARLLRTGGRRQGGRHDKANQQVLLVANKCDDASKEPGAAEAGRLGFGHPLCVSAITRHGKRELIDTILSQLPAADAMPAVSDARDQDAAVKIAIVGKRNAGKSTLVNALAGALTGQERVIVSEVPGTTRDSVDVRFEMDGRAFIAIDTAGLRKRKSIESDIEYYSHHRSLRSIRRADVAILLIDSTVAVSQVDRQLVGELLRHHKPTVVVINKWDLVREQHTQDEYVKYLDGVLKGMSFAPIVFISAKHDTDLRDLVAMAFNLHQQAGHRIGTGELNRILDEIFTQRLPSSKVGKRPKVFYATQLDTHPPTLGLWVNDPELFDGGYQRFLLNRLREVVPFSEVPIQLVFKPRGTPRGDG